MSLAATRNLDLPGLRLQKQIGRGADSVVYRASRGVDTVAVKLPRAAAGELDEVQRRRFLREGCILACLSHPVLPHIYEVDEAGRTPYIVLEYVEGATLAKTLEAGPLAVEEILAIGRQLADALAQVHEHGLVHRDIHPKNILLDEATPRLVDFGLAAAAAGEAAQRMEGTLRYMAPEQGGMLDRPVDARSDLYALGAVLYHCATGKPPYDGDSRHEILRQHATAPVPDPRQERPKLPRPLAALIQRLLSKDPADRYPSARRLVADFDHLQSADRGADAASIIREAFETNSATGTGLVGRRVELQEMLEAWSKAREGRQTMVLLEGPPGCGKSRLVEEAARGARDEGALVLKATGLADEPYPFAPLQRMFAPLFDYLDRADRSTRALATELLRRAAGEYAGPLARLLPRLGELLGHSSSGSGGEEGRADALYEGVASLIRHLAAAIGGAMLVVDNAQWLDDATERVLERLDFSDEQAPLLIAVVVDDTRDQTARAERLAGEFRGSLYARMRLDTLEASDVDALVRAQLSSAKVDAEIIERIHEVSQGNAYAVESFIRAMLDAAVLRPSWGRWHLDSEELSRLTLPDDMTELLEMHLEQLGEQARGVLSWVAIFASSAPLAALAECTGLQTDALDQVYSEAAQAGLLRVEADGGWALVHDSLRDSLLASLDTQQVRERHQAVAEALDDGENAEEQLYQLARHYALGLPEQNPARVVEINHRAGLLARRNFAFHRALDFLSAAAELAEQYEIELDGELDADLGEIAARTGRLLLARRHIERALDSIGEPVRRAELRTRLVSVELTNLNAPEARLELERAFRELGEKLPETRAADLVGSVSRWARAELRTRMPRIFTRMGRTRDPERLRVLLELYNVAARVAYFLFDDQTFLQSALRQHDIAVTLGDSSQLAGTHVLVGFMAALIGQHSLAQGHLERARHHVDQSEDRGIAGVVQSTTAWAVDVRGDTIEAASIMREALAEQGQWMEAWEFATNSSTLIENLSLRGHFREAHEVGERALRELESRVEDIDGSVNHVITPVGAMFLGAMAALGNRENRRRYEKRCELYFESTESELYYHAVIYHCLLLYQVELDEVGEQAQRYIDAFEALPLDRPKVPFYLRIFYVAKGWVALRRCEKARQAGESADLAFFDEVLEELGQIAEVPVYIAYHQLFHGARARLQGDMEQAHDCLERARRHADAADMPLVHFEIARQSALIHREAGAFDVSTRYVRQALQLAADQGWVPRTRRVRAEFSDQLREAEAAASGLTTTGGFTSSDYVTARMQRQMDALMRIHQALSEVGRPHEKLEQVLDELIAIFGAERGFFFHISEDRREPVLEAARNAAGESKFDPEAEVLEVDWAEGVVEQVFATQKPLVVTSIREGNRWDPTAFSSGLRSAVAVPMHTRGKLRGIVYLDSRLAEGVFSSGDVRTLQALANSLSVLLEAARTARLEEQVAQASARSAALLEHATSSVQIGLGTMGVDGDLVDVSPTLHEMAEPWNSTGAWWEQVHAACDWGELEICPECGQREYLGSAFADISAPDGERFVFEVTSTGHGHELTEGSSEHVLLVRDVTERVEADEHLHQLNEELKGARDAAMSASRAKSSFLANMSHELRTPLNAIIGYSEMLLEDYSEQDDPELVSDLSRIQVAGKHLLRLISDILDLSKIEAGRIELNPGEFDLAEMLDDIETTARPLVEENGNELRVEDSQQLTLYNDETKLRQILLNLVGNAAKFTEGGTVSLSVDTSEDDWLTFEVADTGIGMSEEQLHKLFEAFYQANEGSGGRHGGTGLGLTITRRFCQMMGGAIEVDSVEDEGTTFIIRIPVRVEKSDQDWDE